MNQKPNIDIIPKPEKIIIKEGFFEISQSSCIINKCANLKLGQILKDQLNSFFRINLQIKGKEPLENYNKIIIDIINGGKEEKFDYYSINISDNELSIVGHSDCGIFYGIQTIIQLLFLNNDNYSENYVPTKLFIPQLELNDYARFKWRGFMLDESRHFFGKEEIKKLLNILSLLKFNVFHWHLTDDQGWRVEIKRYPKLTQIGSKRSHEKLSLRKTKKKEPIYSGFYSQNDIKEIVDHANEKFITIVPEIDLPGHTTALLASYPELGCFNKPLEVSTKFGIHKDILCAGKDSVFEFCENLLNEIIKLFPGKYIHIGSDEVPKDMWKSCTNCQKRMELEGLENEEQLYHYFINRISEHILSKNRIPITWNDVLNDNLIKDITCQFWFDNLDLVLKHLKNGRNFVMSDMNYVYLDYGLKRTPLQKTYSYEPIPNNLEKDFSKHVLGLEACLWTEFVPNVEKLESSMFPRILAVAEIGWSTKGNRDYQSFLERLKSFLKMAEFFNIKFPPQETYYQNSV